MSLNEEQQLELKKVRDALDNIYDRLNIELYEKVTGSEFSGDSSSTPLERIEKAVEKWLEENK